MFHSRHLVSLLFVLITLIAGDSLTAQVTTATLYGVVRDPTSAVLPGAGVTVTNQGTGLSREILTNERGEFALPALPAGTYTLRIELPGFKVYTNAGLSLGVGQTVRQTFVLEVGQLTENITVSESTPLVATATAAQQESLGLQEVTQLPIARRNIVNLMTLAPGVTENSTGIAGGGNIRLNGVAEGGTAITIDGTDAVSNPETRGTGTYGGQNQISVISIEAVAELQVIKGILPAEYGGAAGGQVNMLSRSGTNAFHGSLFENYQGEEFSARDPFLAASVPKPQVRFNQFGGSLGGPIVRNRAMFFVAYEGYRETAGVTVQGNTPTPAVRNQILNALPFPETKIVLDQLPEPNEPIDAQMGRWRGTKERERRDNHLTAKGDIVVSGGNLSVTYTRMRPYTRNPSYYTTNGQNFYNQQDRIATQYVLARGPWVSESRFGYNRSFLDRYQDFWFILDPANPEEPEKTTVGRRIPLFNIANLFGTPSAEILELRGHTTSAEQKFSRIVGAHNLKTGFRWMRNGGGKTNPQNPIHSFQTLADLSANVLNSLRLDNGKPPHDGYLEEYGGFIQDDWRVNSRLVLNAGLRYDYYPTIRIDAKTSTPAEIVNREPATDLRKMDFGAFRPGDKPYDSDGNNFAPRIGFAWTVDQSGNTVVRGGVGFLFSPHLFATLQNAISDPFGPADVQFNRTEVAQRGLKWPTYGEELVKLFPRETGGEKRIFYLMDTNLPTPYTMQTMINVQRSFGSSWMTEAGYVRTDGRNFPLHRAFTLAFDRETGARPNPSLGSPAGYYISSEEETVYNAMQLSLRRRYSSNFGLDLHYTLRKGWAIQGGTLASPFVNSEISNSQDFFDPFGDRSPLSQEPRHQVSGNVIYGLPWFNDNSGALSHILGGWQIATIVSVRSGLPLRITQPSGIGNSRPDFTGGSAVFENWGETLQYLNRTSFAPVPTYAATRATTRPGTSNPSQVRGPQRWVVDLSLGKTFQLTESVALQVRGEAFNVLNHVNYNNPNTNTTSADFGRITSAGAARSGQIGARLTF